MLLSVWSMNGLYVQSQSFTMSIPHFYWSPCVSAYTDNYHSWLSHPSSRVFNFLVSNNKMTCNSKSFNFQCQACPLGKSSRLSLGSTGHKTSTPFDLIFNNVWGQLLIFPLIIYFILLFLCIIIQNVYDIILLLWNVMSFLSFIVFKPLLSVNFPKQLSGCLFLWLLLLLKKTTENKCLVTEETLFISWGTHHVLCFERRSANSSFMLLLFATIHSKLFAFVRRLFIYVYSVNCYDWEREEVYPCWRWSKWIWCTLDNASCSSFSFLFLLFFLFCCFLFLFWLVLSLSLSTGFGPLFFLLLHLCLFACVSFLICCSKGESRGGWYTWRQSRCSCVGWPVLSSLCFYFSFAYSSIFLH